MHQFIGYFNAAPDWHRVLLFTFVTFCIWNIEILKPLHNDFRKWQHAKKNVLFLILVSPVQLAMGTGINTVLRFTEHYRVGLLNLAAFQHHPLSILIVGFILLDLGEYTYHFIMHKFKVLWLIHAVHHIEEEVDVSTTLREHPAETAVRLIFLMGWILILGVPLWALMFRQFIQIISNLLSHSNFEFPEKTNRVVSILFITPNLHHIHHHFEQPYTDRNYGDVLSVWDRIFGTFCNDQLTVNYGVDTFKNDERRRDLKYLIAMPFKKEYSSRSKRAILFFCFCISFSTVGAQSSAADLVVGKWISAERNLEIEVYKVQNEFYGKIIWFACVPPKPPMEEYLDENNPLKALRKRHWLGMITLTNLKYAGNNKWENGKVYEPNSGHTYSASAKLKDRNTVYVRGYWGIELFGKSLTFNRVRN
ncbi:MAG: DUF2147 domain-containing protein [Bacteroidetes bacterium]|nr:DUF2147 domain-containing protein [Bacteroidota bacterium]